MIYRVNGITIETHYDAYYNIWYAKAYDRDQCYFTNRRLHEGVYPFFNGIEANVDYGSAKPYGTDNSLHSEVDCINNAVIDFTRPCQLVNTRRLPCG